MESDEKLFYSIGEVAKKFDVNASLIRFWEKEFDIIKPRKNKKGNRMFTKEDIQSFGMIYSLVKERGYTLQGAKEILRNKLPQTTSTAEVVQRLESIKSFLEELRASL